MWAVAFRIAAGELKRRSRFAMIREDSYELDHRAYEVISGLARLSPRQRSAIVLRYYGGYTSREIAAMTGSTAATVAVHLHRGRRRLRELLGEEGEGHDG